MIAVNAIQKIIVNIMRPALQGFSAVFPGTTICRSFQRNSFGLALYQSVFWSAGIQTTIRRPPNLVKKMALSLKGGGMADSISAESKNSIVQALTTVRSGGDFCAGGRVPLPNPGLAIDGVGNISLPLLSEQATAIKQLARQAPFGKGKETVLDTSVRNSLQIDASKAAFLNPEWNQAVQDLARLACHTMGLAVHNVRAELYNLLLYEAGGHFKTHQDTEKEDGMFGTLVVQFPSKHQGGDFIVRHSDLQRVFKLGVDDPSSQYCYHYVAHYADCEHEVRPVTDGNRLVAVYSLCWKGNGQIPTAPNMAPVLELAKHLPKIGNKTLGLLMKHEYTEYSLTKYGLRALKGIDRALAGTFIAASNVMKEQNAANELIFHIAQLQRTREPRNLEAATEVCVPFVCGHVFNVDGRKVKKSEAISSFNFFDDVLNYKETDTDSIDAIPVECLDEEERVNGYFQNYGDVNAKDRYLEVEEKHDDSDELPWYKCSGVWWKFERELGYTGNARHEDETEYSGCLLSFHRADDGSTI